MPFHHRFCGGKHDTVSEARDCQGTGRQMATFRTEPKPQEAKTFKSLTPASEGFYRTPGGLYVKVQLALHGSGRPYAKSLVVVQEAIKQPDGRLARDPDGKIIQPALLRWQKADGMQYRLRPEWKLTLKEAGEFGALYGVCIKCGLPLTKEESIARGMGDVCAGLVGTPARRAKYQRLYRQEAA